MSDQPLVVREPPVVSVVLGTYNRRTFLKAAIESVRQAELPGKCETIVIDGGSTDGSLDWLCRQKDLVTIIQHNRGDFRGQPISRRSWGYFMNLGFKAAQGRYVLMISDDCLLVPGAIAQGVARLGALETAGQRIGAGAFYFRNWPEERDYYVQRTLGGMLMVNHGLYVRRVLEEIGWADEERYMFYKADGDLSLRIWQAGYEIVDCPDSFLEHYGHANEAVRKSNNDTLRRDRSAYFERWRGIYYHPDRPEQRERLSKPYSDPAHTVRLFPAQPVSRRPIRQIVREGLKKYVPARLLQLVRAGASRWS